MKNNLDGKPFQRIKELMTRWASLAIDKSKKGFYGQVAFATERVQDDNFKTADYDTAWPADIKRLNNFIESMAPIFKKIIRVAYLDRTPQKRKADILNMPREVFNRRLVFIHEQLEYNMFGEIV